MSRVLAKKNFRQCDHLSAYSNPPRCVQKLLVVLHVLTTVYIGKNVTLQATWNSALSSQSMPVLVGFSEQASQASNPSSTVIHSSDSILIEHPLSVSASERAQLLHIERSLWFSATQVLTEEFATAHSHWYLMTSFVGQKPRSTDVSATMSMLKMYAQDAGYIIAAWGLISKRWWAFCIDATGNVLRIVCHSSPSTICPQELRTSVCSHAHLAVVFGEQLSKGTLQQYQAEHTIPIARFNPLYKTQASLTLETQQRCLQLAHLLAPIVYPALCELPEVN
jgi:hypothetical protein